jgi:epoxyqueuosine reductase
MNLLQEYLPKEFVRKAFGIEGFHRCGVVDLKEAFKSGRMQRDLRESVSFVQEFRHGTMRFLENQILAKSDPNLLLDGVQSAVMVMVPYSGGMSSSSPILSQIARYAHVRDYHRSLKRALENVSRNLSEVLEKQFISRPVVDSAPFLERSFAREAGLGFVGKHTCLIVPGLGSFAFIAALLTNLDVSELAIRASDSLLDTPDPSPTFCGDCRRCLDACPTGAFISPYKMDAKKCLAYLSIEHRGLVDDVFVPAFSHGIFGCDICQEVCPFNRVAKSVKASVPPLRLFDPPSIAVADVATMSQVQYEQWFGGSSLTRAKYEGLVRNALYHLYATSSSQLEIAMATWEASDNEFLRRVVEQIRRLLKESPKSEG